MRVRFRSRTGSFNPDESGNLVIAAVYYLQGYNLRNGAPPPSSSTFTGMETVNISNLSGSAAATTNIALGVNLPSTADVGDSHFVTAQVFDSLGNAHDMDITFTKTAVNAWSWAASDPTLAGGATPSGSAVGTAAITFDTAGTPLSFTPAAPRAPLTGPTPRPGNSPHT